MDDDNCAWRRTHRDLVIGRWSPHAGPGPRPGGRAAPNGLAPFVLRAFFITDGYRDFVAIGGQDEHVQVLDLGRGIVVALVDRRRNSDKIVYALTTAKVGLRRMLFAAGGSRDIVAYELPEQGLPAAGDPAILPRLRGEIQHEDSVSALAVLPADPPILASAGLDEYIRLTRLQPADPLARNDPRLARQFRFSPMPDIERPHGGYQVRALAVTGSLLLSGGADGAVRVWHVDAGGGHPVATVPLDAPVRNMVAIDGTVVVATDLGTVGLRLSHVEAQP
jgi:WD40 repeat protein